MTDYGQRALQRSHTTDTDVPTSTIDRRDADALTRSMTVLPDTGDAKDADDVYLVVSDSGREYVVDAREGRCTCPDFEYRETRCIHQRRVAFATGERDVPNWANDAAVDDHLGQHVDRVATDGRGPIVEDATTADQPVDVDDDRPDELPADPEDVSIADTGAGLLVFEVEREDRTHVDGEVEVSRRLVGFADVQDWDAIADAVRARGHGHGDVLHLPEFDVDDLPETSAPVRREA